MVSKWRRDCTMAPPGMQGCRFGSESIPDSMLYARPISFYARTKSHSSLLNQPRQVAYTSGIAWVEPRSLLEGDICPCGAVFLAGNLGLAWMPALLPLVANIGLTVGATLDSGSSGRAWLLAHAAWRIA